MICTRTPAGPLTKPCTTRKATIDTVSIFCSRGKAFARDSFQSSMKEMECRPIIYHKLYVGLDEWRQLASDFDDENAFVTPPAFMEQLTRASTSTSSNEGDDDEDLVVI